MAKNKKPLHQFILILLVLLAGGLLIMPQVGFGQKNPSKPTRRATSTIPYDAETKRNFSSLLGQRMAAYLNNLRVLIERSAAIAQGEKNKLRDQIAKDVSVIQNRAITLSKVQNVKELDERIAALKDFWRSKERRMNYYRGLIVSSRIRHAFERLSLVETKLDVLIERLTANNISVEEILKLKERLHEELRQAQESYNQAQQLFNQMESASNANELFTEGNKHLKKAHEFVRDARETIRLIMQKIRFASPESFPSATTSPTQP